MRPLLSLIQAQERRNYNPYTFFLFCIFTGLMRGILEIFLHNIQIRNTEVVGFIPFYISLGLLLREILALLGGISREKVEKSLIMGIFLGLFPPIFDLFLPAPAPVFYGYYFLWDFRNIPWLGYNPYFNFPAGECVTIWLSILFCALYVHAQTGKIFRALMALAAAYLIFIFCGSLFPMLLFRVSQGLAATVEAVRAIDFVRLQMFLLRLSFWQAILALALLLVSRKTLLVHTLRRLPHGLPFICLAILGGTLVKASTEFLISATSALLAVIILAIWQNDHFDFRDDGNTEPPVAKHELQSWTIVTLITLLFLFFQNQRSSILLFVALVASTLYNYPFYRGRNHFPANLKIEGIWGVSAFLAGALLDPVAAQDFRVKITALLIFGGWSSVSVWKDLKDIESDKRAGVATVFTLLEKRGFPRTKIVIGVRSVVTFFFLLLPLIAFVTINATAGAILMATACLPVACLWLGEGKKAFQWGLVAVALNILAAVALVHLGIWRA